MHGLLHPSLHALFTWREGKHMIHKQWSFIQGSKIDHCLHWFLSLLVGCHCWSAMTDHFFYLPPWLINNRWWDHFASLCLRLFLWKACSQEIFLGSGHQCNDIFFYRGVKNCQLITQTLPDFSSFQLVFGEWASTYNCFPDSVVFQTFHGHQDIKLCYLAYAWVHSRSLSHSIFPEL